MKRILGHIVSLLVVGTVVGTLMPACAANDQSLFIRAALAPSVSRANGACTYTSDPTQLALFQAHLDVGVTDSYFAVLLVGSQLIAKGDPQNNRAESNRAHINGGIVRVTEPDGKLIREFTSLASGFNDPQQNSAANYGPVGLVVIDALTRDLLLPALPTRAASKTILVNVKVFGTTLGNVDMESGEYQLPMQVCNGCLVDFSTGYDPTSKTQPLNCDKALGMGSTTNIPCFRGQDENVPCQLCRGRKACDPSAL